MFKSKRRNLIYPQSEHQRIAGALAQLWGNTNFEKPNLPFHSFVAGVALHDGGYGLTDNYSIGDMSEKQRRQALKLLLEYQLSDNVAEAVMLHHVLRLVKMSHNPDLASECEERIAKLIKQTGIAAVDYQAADRITRLCDKIAFDFCFEMPLTDGVEVFSHHTQQTTSFVSYEVTETHKVFIDPWPLAVPLYQGYVLTYEAESYPDELRPVLVRYKLAPK